MLGKKAQAALEFLITYGWAILVFLIAVGSLAYFGILSPDKFLSEKCMLPAGIACLDFEVENHRIILVLQNGLAETITINKITASANNQECSDAQSLVMRNSEKATFTLTSCNNGASNAMFKGTINVNYTLEDNLAHSSAGILRAVVGEGSSISSQSICQNAQTSGLCGGLDIVYGSGYRSACCGEFGLCCG